MNGEQSTEWITADSLVGDVVSRHPQVIHALSRRGLRCAGCYISPFHTIADTAREYAMAVDPLLSDLRAAIAAGSTESQPEESS